MRDVRVNPLYLAAFFYLSINFFYTIVGFQVGSMELEFQFKPINNSSFFYAFIFQFFSILMILIAYEIASKFLSKQSSFEISNKTAILLLLGQLFYLIVNMIYGSNRAGDFQVFQGSAFLNIFFILLPFDVLYLILGVSIKSKKIFHLNSLVYIVSSLMRGWMGGVFLLLFVYVCRNNGFVLNLRAIFNFIFIFIFILIISPYLIEMKWIIRSNENIVGLISNVNDRGYLSELFLAVDYMFNRFQHVGHVALIVENSDYLAGQYSSGRMVPYWAEGIVQSIFMNIFKIDSFMTFPRLVTVDLFHISPAVSWTTNVGMAGWFFVLGYNVVFYLIYLTFLLLFPFIFVAKFANKQMLLLISVFSIFYLFHGWFYAYFTMVVYVLLVVLLKRIKR